jgi:hypothetical protein
VERPGRWILRGVAIADQSAFSNADAYITQMKGGDGARAFLKIMRGFDLTQTKQDHFHRGLSGRPYPAQVVWGDLDVMQNSVRRDAVMDALGLTSHVSLPAKHFTPEDQAPAIAAAVATLAHANA